MTTMVAELYEALKKVGVDDDTARAAAKAVMGRDDRDHLATKADIVSLKVEMVEMKAELIKWNVGTLVALAGIVAAIVKLV